MDQLERPVDYVCSYIKFVNCKYEVQFFFYYLTCLLETNVFQKHIKKYMVLLDSNLLDHLLEIDVFDFLFYFWLPFEWPSENV